MQAKKESMIELVVTQVVQFVFMLGLDLFKKHTHFFYFSFFLLKYATLGPA